MNHDVRSGMVEPEDVHHVREKAMVEVIRKQHAGSTVDPASKRRC